MTITKSELKQMIKEAINEALNTSKRPVRKIRESSDARIPAPWNKYYIVADNGVELDSDYGRSDNHVAWIGLKDCKTDTCPKSLLAIHNGELVSTEDGYVYVDLDNEKEYTFNEVKRIIERNAK